MVEVIKFIVLIVFAIIVFSVVIIVFAVPFALLTGMVLSDLWLWFMVPLGVPAIGVAHACGITTIPGIFLFLPAQGHS